MLFDKRSKKDTQKRITRKYCIEHKISMLIRVMLMLSFLLFGILFVVFERMMINKAWLFLLAAVYCTWISKAIGKMISRKFVGQVNQMTQLAKVIADSNDLSKRVAISDHPDELSNLEEALNGMITRLEDAFEKQKRFVSNASHELRTPVSVMQGYLDILNAWGKDDQELLEESLQSMTEETYHMKSLIENLLFLARADQERLLYEPQTIQLNELIDKLIKDTRLITEQRIIKSDRNESVKIIGDPRLILQMLRALVENSIKYTDPGGMIRINCERCGEQARVEMIDDGIGIPETDQERIFDRFYRVDSARHKKTGGSGLGLSLVKKIIERHEGDIEVESALGEGTKMIIVLPLSEEVEC